MEGLKNKPCKWIIGSLLLIGISVCISIGLTGWLVYLLSLLFPFEFSWRVTTIVWGIIVLIKLLFGNGGGRGDGRTGYGLDGI